MAQISALAISEAVRVDSRRVAEIVAELGETSAQHVIGLALEQLAAALTAVDGALDDADLAQAAAHAERMSRLAWQIGLLSLAGVAMDLGSTAERGDVPALAAIRARLLRVGNRSLTAIWDRTALA
ncbi:hypothetical protein TW83_06480 [Paracoccus sp. S4493]|jgi:hypothetical protein|uniref:Uncharacterized protein n=1 Tax=Paracoccus marcusii TaxID=59779 RepID=A0ABY7UU53_9RHOB|nr:MULTISPECIES: hypothetical protein [Paracoccus]TYP68588.1 hypothetical protein A9A71_104182 [Stutzerimonas stutzeri]KIX17414.1 hypothetical protein SY26_10620 [Paracoccus sp. 228]KJZ31928.1 hypothetical protein TW83_06480 [Paracoccus sp. S4493]MBF5079028.1 hypothetical protein [Paracoccus sp. NBH48]MCO6361382.1 hypothetical protein [Paracoccus sp. 08]|tara:strand:- start:6261 stop:6638 length:378 start_codon:yes stop_codon:yes gene_type:complete